MKLSDRSQIEGLSGFAGGGIFMTSFFLDTDKSRLTKKDISASISQLHHEGKGRLELMGSGRERKDSLTADMEAIDRYCTQNIPSYNHSGLALFSCSAKGFFQPLFLPHGPRNRIIFDQNFYVRPLLAILEKYRRICALLINRREARWFGIHVGEITPLETLVSDVPARVKEAGFEGTEGKHIERHIEAHLLEHFRKAAQATFDLFKKNRYDWLFLSCEDSLHTGLEPLLHRYVRDRLKGRLKAKPADPQDRILKEVLALEEELNAAEEAGTVQKLVAEIERGGKACSGVRETLQRLNQTEVQTLVVSHNFSREGRICPNDKFLYLEEPACPVCLRKTEPVLDIIDEAIESAMSHGGSVVQINAPTRLDRYGKIGALLKYKT
jgi:peptide subunit release factor 1 (eRF1)